MDLTEHYQTVSRQIRECRVVPFLGAGVNLSDRPEQYEWKPKQAQQLPSASELAGYLARRFHYCRPDCDLTRVSQYVEVILGAIELNDELRTVFRPEYPLTETHRFLSSLPPGPSGYPLFVTTNYDNLLERALLERRQDFDLVYYDPGEESGGGRFWHRPPGEGPQLIDRKCKDQYEFLARRPAILKIHGTVCADHEESEGFVITENHYIEFLAEDALQVMLPASLLAKLRRSHLLFLGYSLRDWNFRVFLRRLKRNPKERSRCWAIVALCDAAEEKFWAMHNTDMIAQDLKEYIPALRQALEAGHAAEA